METDIWDLLVKIMTIWLPQIVTVASVIAAATPTKADDLWLDRGIKLIGMFALNVGGAKPKE